MGGSARAAFLRSIAKPRDTETKLRIRLWAYPRCLPFSCQIAVPRSPQIGQFRSVRLAIDRPPPVSLIAGTCSGEWPFCWLLIIDENKLFGSAAERKPNLQSMKTLAARRRDVYSSERFWYRRNAGRARMLFSPSPSAVGKRYSVAIRDPEIKIGILIGMWASPLYFFCI